MSDQLPEHACRALVRRFGAECALAGQVTLGRHYRRLIEANPRHRIARDAWLALYVFVAIQMGWVLRPFVGNPDQPTGFFREGAWSNAYVVIAGIVWRAIQR